MLGGAFLRRVGCLGPSISVTVSSYLCNPTSLTAHKFLLLLQQIRSMSKSKKKDKQPPPRSPPESAFPPRLPTNASKEAMARKSSTGDVQTKTSKDSVIDANHPSMPILLDPIKTTTTSSNNATTTRTRTGAKPSSTLSSSIAIGVKPQSNSLAVSSSPNYKKDAAFEGAGNSEAVGSRLARRPPKAPTPNKKPSLTLLGVNPSLNPLALLSKSSQKPSGEGLGVDPRLLPWYYDYSDPLDIDDSKSQLEAGCFAGRTKIKPDKAVEPSDDVDFEVAHIWQDSKPQLGALCAAGRAGLKSERTSIPNDGRDADNFEEGSEMESLLTRMSHLEPEVSALKSELDSANREISMLRSQVKTLQCSGDDEKESLLSAYTKETDDTETDQNTLEAEEDNDQTLPEDTFSFIIVSTGCGTAFNAATLVFLTQMAVFLLMLVDMTDPSADNGNIFGIPANIGMAVRVGQVVALVITILTQDDVIKGIELIRVAHSSSFQQALPNVQYWENSALYLHAVGGGQCGNSGQHDPHLCGG